MAQSAVNTVDFENEAFFGDLRARVNELARSIKELHRREQEELEQLPEKAWVLMYRGQGGIGIHTIQTDQGGQGMDTILLFESMDEAQRFAWVLGSQGFNEPSPRFCVVGKIREGFDGNSSVKLRFVPKGSCLLPPEESVADPTFQVGSPRSESDSALSIADAHIAEAQLDHMRANLEAQFKV